MFDFTMHVMWVKMTNLTLPLEFAQKEADMDMATAKMKQLRVHHLLPLGYQCYQSS
jgi:hypothetical protein